MLIKINGRLRHFRRITAVKLDRPGRYVVESSIGRYAVEGGRHAGGTRRQWFLEPIGETPIFRGTSKAIDTTSLMDALRLIETA